MCDVLVAMGVEVIRSDEHELTIIVPNKIVPEAPYELVEMMRASIVVMGPLLGRLGVARVALPGGDDFGPRPIDMHLRGLEALGATFTTSHGYIEGHAEQLTGARVVLEFPSVGATENVLMAAVKAKGRTVIDNAAREPEIADLAAFLTRMGANIVGAGSSTIEIQGVDDLAPVDHTVIPDRIEAADVPRRLRDRGWGDHSRRSAPRPHAHAGLQARRHGDAHLSDHWRPVGAVDRKASLGRRLDLALPRHRDRLQALTGRAPLARGWGGDRDREPLPRSLSVRGRVDPYGGDIRTEGTHAVVRGVERLSGAPVRAHDIRAGARAGGRCSRRRFRDSRGRRAPHRPGLRAVRREAPGIGRARRPPACR